MFEHPVSIKNANKPAVIFFIFFTPSKQNNYSMFFVDKPQTFDDNKTKNDNLNYRFLLWIYFWILY